MLKQAPAVFQRIDASGMGQLVDSAFYRRKIARRTDSAPVAGQHSFRGLMADEVGVFVRDRIGSFCAGHDVEVYAVAGECRQPARHYGRADDAVTPGNGHAVGTQGRRDLAVVQITIAVVADVLLAAPDDLDRAIDLLCDFRRQNNPVDVKPPPETATQQVVVHNDLLQW